MNKTSVKDRMKHPCNAVARLCRFVVSAAVLWLGLASCSLTSHLPQGEVLYTGVSRIDHNRVDTVDDVVAEAVATALEVQPNSAFLGSAYHMSPFPVGLWVFNGLHPDRETGFRHWLWQHFKSDPTLVSQVNPRLRAQAAEAALKDEGYFDAEVTFDTLYHPSDSLRAKIGYSVTYQHHHHLGQVTRVRSREARIDSILSHTQSLTRLHPGQRFSSADLEAERDRIATTLQDSGYFFFHPDHVRFIADTTRLPNTVDLRILIGVGADSKALLPCTIDSVHFRLDHGAGLQSQNHDTLGFVTLGYNGPLMVRPTHLRRSLGFQQHALYSPDRIQLAKTLISRLNTFKYTTTEFQLIQKEVDTLAIDSSASSVFNSVPDTTSLRLIVSGTYALPWSGVTEIGAVHKDNGYVGPGATLTATRRNLWGGGEQLSFELNGIYEWRLSDSYNKELHNSFELGTKATLSVPRLQLPHFFQPASEKPVSSSYSLSLDWMRRSPFFEMLRAGGSIEYGFSYDRVNTFVFTPLRLSYVSLIKTSDDFKVVLNQYPSLNHSFEDQFIPQIQVSWTYDNTPFASQSRNTSQYLNVTIAEAGGLTDVLMGQFGTHREQGHRQLFFQPFSQFLKATAEFRNLHHLSRRLTLASRLMGGIGYAYGNSTQMPYAEQFYIGGPNSLRGFPVRGIGPGSCTAFSDGDYSYLNRVGDLKFEGNVELRFPIAGSLYGALFADAGNVWYLKDSHPDLRHIFEKISDSPYYGERLRSDFLRQLALDAGFGFRLDMGMLVLRFDIGIPLHDPNSDGPSYFNRRHGFLKQPEYNLAVGYPF